MLKQQLSRCVLFISRVLRIDGYIPDRLYLQMLYRRLLNKKLDLHSPKSFNEKMQWLKLYDRRPEYTTMVDKFAVKKYVADMIGEEYIIPTLGKWDRPEDIEWDKLPEQFVLKCTHDSGGLVICRDKSKLDKQAAMDKLRFSLRRDYFKAGREWPYKDVPRQIMAEKYMEDATLVDLRDYKFFCFNGKVKVFKVDFDRHIEHHANYFDRTGKLLPYGENACPPILDKQLSIPENLPQMIALAEKLAKDKSFVRIDFYNINEHIYFGEITFFPAGGLGSFNKEEFDYMMGDWIQLPKNK